MGTWKSLLGIGLLILVLSIWIEIVKGNAIVVFMHYYIEQKKKRNNRPPKIFEFNGKTLIISGLLLYDSHSWDIRVYHAKN